MDDPVAAPLLDLLEQVPHSARATYEHGGESHNIPYGRLCREAATKIRFLELRNIALTSLLAELYTALKPNYSLSPEGRAFLQKIEDLLPNHLKQ